MPDSSDVDSALVAKLLADGPLMAIATDGVYFDEAAPGATKFVIVSLMDENDEPQFGGRSFEDATYLVKFVALSTSGANVKTAAARIDTLLDGGTLTVSGYSLMTMRRDSRIRMTEVDEVDPSIRWQHRGGNYQVVVST
jgi:hypothetical protein